MAEIHSTFCRICAAGCGLRVETEGPAVLGVRGDRAHPLSAGYTCPKGRALPQLHHAPERLSAPLLRRGDALAEASWEECLSDLGARLRAICERHGPPAIGFFLGSGGYFDSAGLFTAMRLREALGTPSFYSDTTIDVISTMVVSELVTGRPGLLAKPDLERTPLLIIVGSNPVVSHGQTQIFANPVTQLRALRARGALWVIDPRRTRTAELANHHLAVRPGGDHAIFAFLVRELLRSGADRDYLARHASGVEALERAVEPFDNAFAAQRSGVPSESLDALLGRLREAGRVSVLTGTGLSMAPDANLANWFIWALHVITHSADVPGGVSFNPGFYSAPECAPALPAATSRSAGPRSRPELSSWLGEYPCSALADEVEAGNLRALIVLGGNPALQMPDTARTERALRRLEVLAVADVLPTETTALASHVLACAGQLERADLTLVHDSLLPHVMAQYTPALVRRAPGRRSLWWVLRELGRALGRDPFPQHARELEDDDVLREATATARCGLDELRRAGLEGQPVIAERSVFGWVHERVLPGGRWRLAPPELVAQLAALAQPPALALVPRRELRHQNSQHRGLAEPARIWLNPADAAAAGVRDGERVEVKSATGSVLGTALVTDQIRSGAISIPHGFAEPCVNRLVSALEVDPLTGMPHMSGTALALGPGRAQVDD